MSVTVLDAGNCPYSQPSPGLKEDTGKWAITLQRVRSYSGQVLATKGTQKHWISLRLGGGEFFKFLTFIYY